ncbi:GNAT family N-acetyltransferase [Pseudarthrobacter sp. N5]|uniref:GNAT family N-acetyltransferase n=1 Tax=Pseudarthrobacter sp. N5 TaxID=3418416 RepID=UPI003CEE6662
MPVTERFMPTVRRLAATEWQALRDIRLEMITDTPMAYVEALDSARNQTEMQWRTRATSMSTAGSVALVADHGAVGGKLSALMRVVVKIPQDTYRPLQAMLVSVYVVPELRGSGLAAELLHEAVTVAREDLGAGILQLGVHEDNARAMAFYERNGFTDTGRREPYPLDTSTSEIIMELELTPRADANSTA